jgi:hypothetical protein
MVKTFAGYCTVFCLATAACGGSTTSTAISCGPGTTLVNGQCVASEVGGGSGEGGAGGGAGDGTVMAGGSVGGAGTTTVPSLDAGREAALDDFCSGRDVVATGSPGLFDDFEDGDTRVLANDGRTGIWVLFAQGCTPTPPASKPLPEPPAPGNASKYALHVTGTGCMSIHDIGAFNGFGDGVNAGNCAYDASSYDGMYFWAIGAGVRVDIMMGMRSTTPLKFGGDGTCAQDAMDKGCFDHYLVTKALTGEWKQYSFTWNQLRQGGWGTKAVWDVKQVTDFTVAGSNNDSTATTLDFSIDDVGFFKGSPPPDPPAPRP